MIYNIIKKIYYFIKFNFLIRNNERFVSNKILKDYCAKVKGNVLNIGSGDGRDKTGDNYKNYFKCTKDYTTLEYEEGQSDLVGDIQNMPEMKNEIYDCIFCIWVLEHVQNINQAISEISRILKKQGTFIFAVPLNVSYHGYPRDYWRFSKDDIFKMLEENGFVVEKINQIGIEKNIVLDKGLNFFGEKISKGPYGHVCLAKKIK